MKPFKLDSDVVLPISLADAFEFFADASTALADIGYRRLAESGEIYEPPRVV
jgi:hypothetical protein